MSGQENEDMGFQRHRSEGYLNPMPDKVSGMAMSSLTMFKSPPMPTNGPSDPFFGSGWDPLCSMGGHAENFGGGSSSMVSHGGDFCNPHYSINNGSVLESQGGMSSTSFAEMAPKLDSCFGSGGFSGIPGGPFGFPNYMPSKDNHERNSMVGGQSQDGSDSAIGSSPNGKRRKRVADPNSPLTCDKVETIV